MKYEWLHPDQISDQDVADINALLFQLADAPNPVDHEKVREVAAKSIWLVVRDDEGRVKGMNTMTISHIPTGKVGHLDDVVVDGSLRGQGVGEQLVQILVNKVRSETLADRIELTCKPDREKANRLYRRLGFQQRATNCYMMKF